MVPSTYIALGSDVLKTGSFSSLSSQPAKDLLPWPFLRVSQPQDSRHLGCLVLCKRFSSLPGLDPLDAFSIPLLQVVGYPKYLRIWPHVPWRRDGAVKNHFPSRMFPNSSALSPSPVGFFFFSSVDFTFSAVNFCIIKLSCCPQECNLHEWKNFDDFIYKAESPEARKAEKCSTEIHWMNKQ